MSTHLFRQFHNHEPGLPEPHSRSGIDTLVFADDGLCNKLGEVSTPTVSVKEILGVSINSQTITLFLLDNK